MKIIDAHAHVVQYISGFTSRGELHGIGGGMARYADGSTFQMIPPEMGEFGASPEALLKVMDENGVEKAVLLQGQFFGFQNEYTAEAAKKISAKICRRGKLRPLLRKGRRCQKASFQRARV